MDSARIVHGLNYRVLPLPWHCCLPVSALHCHHMLCLIKVTMVHCSSEVSVLIKTVQDVVISQLQGSSVVTDTLPSEMPCMGGPVSPVVDLTENDPGVDSVSELGASKCTCNSESATVFEDRWQSGQTTSL